MITRRMDISTHLHIKLPARPAGEDDGVGRLSDFAEGHFADFAERHSSSFTVCGPRAKKYAEEVGPSLTITEDSPRCTSLAACYEIHLGPIIDCARVARGVFGSEAVLGVSVLAGLPVNSTMVEFNHQDIQSLAACNIGYLAVEMYIVD